MRRLTFQRPITKWEYVQLHKAVRTVAEAPELGLEGEPSTRTRRTHARAAHAARTCAVHATLTDSPCYCCTSAGEPSEHVTSMKSRGSARDEFKIETPDVLSSLLIPYNRSERTNDTSISLLTPLSLQFIADPEDDDNHTLTLSGAFGEVPAFFWPNARSQAQKHAS